MIVDFSAVCCCDAQEKAALLARGISEAMTLPAFGLGIALLALALQHVLRARATSSRVESPPPSRVAPGSPGIWLLAPAACLLPVLVVFLFMGASFEPPIRALPMELDTRHSACASEGIGTERPAAPVLVMIPGGIRLETPDGWRLELPTGANGRAEIAQALGVERDLAWEACQGPPRLVLQPSDGTTLEQIVGLMDTCRDQGYTDLLVAARE
jgi:hypothetical protein